MPNAAEKRLLILGFSVTEQRHPEGYARLVASAAKTVQGGLTVDVKGIGGIGIDALAYEFESFVGGGSYDAMLLDLTSTSYRNGRQPGDLAWPVAAVLAKARASGAATAMIHLWRSDVDFQTDLFIAICDRIGALMGVKGYNLGRIASAVPPEERARLFKDEVHTTPAGAEFYFRHILEILPELLSQPNERLDLEIMGPFSTSTFALPISHLAGRRNTAEAYRRSGLALPYVELFEGESLSLSLPEPLILGGISALIGPLTGDFVIRAKALPDRIVTSYDAYAYYSRFFTHMLPEARLDTLQIEQRAGVPDIPLRKGDKDMGARVGTFFTVLGSTMPRAELAAHALRLIET